MADVIPLADQSNPGRGFRDGSGRLINCYVEPRGKEGRWPTPVYPVDGLTSFSELPLQQGGSEDEGSILLEPESPGPPLITAGDALLSEDSDTFYLEGDPFIAAQASPDNGVQVIIADNGYLWAITGYGVYRVGPSGDATFIGSLAASKSVTADINRVNQIGIVSDGNYYVCDTVNSTLTNYTSSLLIGGPNSVVHYNGYMVVTNSNNIYQISNLNDATLWDAADVETAIFRGDTTKRCITRGGDLLIFGSRSLEFWQDVGATNGFTFQRVGATEVGIGPPMSAINLDELVLFIDADLAVRAVSGYTTQLVSTPYVARKIRQATDIDSIRASSHERDGHLFYSISCDDFTLTYNVATELWHEEKSYGIERRVVSTTEKLNNVLYAGDYAEGKIYTMSRDVHKEVTNPIVMEVITPPVHSFPNRIRVKSLFIDAMFGTGLKPETDETEANRMINDPQPAVGEPFDLDRSGDPLAWTASDPLTAVPADSIGPDEEEPKIMVWVSEDDGENFIFLEELSLGDINSKYEELRVQGVGTSDQNGFVFRLTCSAPVVRGIMGMSADMTAIRA